MCAFSARCAKNLVKMYVPESWQAICQQSKALRRVDKDYPLSNSFVLCKSVVVIEALLGCLFCYHGSEPEVQHHLFIPLGLTDYLKDPRPLRI